MEFGVAVSLECLRDNIAQCTTTNLHVYITQGLYVITLLAKLPRLITEFAILIATPAISTYATVLRSS